MMPILKCNGFYSAQNQQTKLFGIFLLRKGEKSFEKNEQENFSNKKYNPKGSDPK